MTTGTLLVILAAVFAVSAFLVGRYFATLSPEKAAEWERKSGKPVDLDGLRLIGKAQMISAPVIGGILAYIGLSGMVD
jgi:hypothetical protein